MGIKNKQYKKKHTNNKNPLDFLNIYTNTLNQMSDAFICKKVEFRDELFICDGKAQFIDYDIRDNLIILRSEFTDSIGLSNVIRVIDKNTISSENGNKKYFYNRSSY